MTHILLFGCGKMGEALLRGWLSSSAPDIKNAQITVIDPKFASSPHPLDDPRVTYYADLRHSVAKPHQIVVLSAKPWDVEDAINCARPLAQNETVWLSIAAGLSIQKLASFIATPAPKIIRAMPNTPAAIGRGVTVITVNQQVDEHNASLATTLLEAVGKVVVVEDEGLMDAVTAVSGSGPAYLYLLQEAMEQTAIEMGLEREVARTLTTETLRGAAEMMVVSLEEPKQLRQNVTSPKGTTEAALSILLADEGFTPMMKKAMLAARDQATKLGK